MKRKWTMFDTLGVASVVIGLLLVVYGFYSAESGWSLRPRPVLGLWGMAVLFFCGAYFLFKRDKRAIGFMKWVAIIFVIPGGLLLILYVVLLLNGPVPASGHAILLVAGLFLAVSLALALVLRKMRKDLSFNSDHDSDKVIGR